MAPRVVIVAHADIRGALAPWVERRTGQGWSVDWLEPSTTSSLHAAPATTVMLVGHPRASGPLRLSTAAHPSPYRHMRGPFHGDHALVHGALEVPPRHAVGRWPARTPAALVAMVERTLLRERAPCAPVIRFVDGDPAWGTAVGAACDVIAGRYAKMALPEGLAATRTTYNPRHGPNAASMLPALAEGARLFVYVGHGQPRSIDGVDAEHLGHHVTGHVPLALLACCHAGRFDDDEPSLAEDWLAAPGGPLGIIAGSNVTDPRLNPAVALAVVKASLAGRTAGEALLAAHHAVTGRAPDLTSAALRVFAVPALRRAHVGLYNLLGDPTAPLS